RGLCEEAGAEPGRVRELRAALARKDASALERTVTDLAPAAHVGEALLALPSLFGHEASAEPGRVRELRAALARKDASALERTVTDLAPAAHVGEALLALPSLFGHEAVLDRAAGFARNKRSAKALANLAEVYRLLTIY